MVACPSSSIHLWLEHFRQVGKYSDVNILVAGKTFKCHRNILAAASSYFDSMFGGNFKESYQQECQLHNIDPELFEQVLQNIYFGQLCITRDNVFNLLCTGEFLSVQTIQDPCIDFILTNMNSIDNVIEIFSWARALNISQLVDPLLACISNDFIHFSETTMFLEIPFDDLRTILMFRFKQPSLFKVDDLFVDALIRWLHHSYLERKHYFQKLDEIVPSVEISIEYSIFLSGKYNVHLPNPVLYNTNSLKYKSFFKTNINCLGGCSDKSLLPSVSFSEHQSLTNPSSIHLYINKKIFSINKYKPDGFISCIKESKIKSVSMAKLFSSSGSDYLYCMEDDSSDSRSFCAYLSIDLLKSNSLYLCPPPVFLKSQGAIDETRKHIYFGPTGGSRKQNIMYPTHYKKFTDKELRSGVFYYNCEVDEWFSVPQVRMEKWIAAQPVIDNIQGLVYFVSSNCKFQAYDIRSSRRLDLPNTTFPSRNYSFCCCAVDGNIFHACVGGKVEMFNSTALKWEILKNEPIIRYDLSVLHREFTFMVPYENMMWLFEETFVPSLRRDVSGVYNLALQVYHPYSKKWLLPHNALSSEIILDKCGFDEHNGDIYDFLNDIVVFKSN